MTTMPPDLTPVHASAGQLPDLALAFAQAGTAEKLSLITASLGRLVSIDGAVDDCVRQLVEGRQRLVFLDFLPSQASRSASLAKHLVTAAPHMALVAVGNSAIADSVLSALRSGVRDFLDLDNTDGDASAIIARALTSGGSDAAGGHAMQPRGKMVAVLGARVGVGVSTISTNLAVVAQRAYGASRGVMLLDFGIPVADASLYLNQKKEFDLLQAINSLSRIDETFIASAFAVHPSGFSLLPMPSKADRMRQISYDDSVALLGALRSFYPTLIADLGGFGDLDFVAAMVRQADEVLLVCDPSAGAMVSARNMLQGLAERGAIVSKLRLLLNKHDDALALNAADVAKRLGVQAQCELQHRHVPMLQAANQGKALAEVAPNDVFTHAVESVVRQFDWLPAHAGTKAKGLVGGLRSLIRR